jgi:hypothetical protein
VRLALRRGVGGGAYGQRMTMCGTCHQEVDRAVHRDAHDPKTCTGDCGLTLPISRFPVALSAGDGRRATCDVCSSAKRRVQSAERVQQKRQDLDSWNTRLRQHGYHWDRCRHHPAHHREWDLFDPAGQQVSEDEAKRRIDEAEWEAHRESDPDW